MLKKYVLSTLLIFGLLGAARATEGMWIPMLLKSLNESDMQANGLRLTAEDIYSINQSSLKDAVVHFGGGCTAEVISDQGLILTNHHCGYSQIQQHSSVENDYLTDGFWAMKGSEELTNPGLTASFIVRMEDVTVQMLQGVEDGMTEEERYRAIGLNAKKLEEAAVTGTHYEAFIRPFFYGNEYYMFITETFNDVRLVGAPPSSIGKFGYDEDNWMWPRHTGDFSIFRIYAGPDNKPAEYSAENKPYQPKHHFPVSVEGVQEGDFTMIYGFPGRTQQYLTSYAVDYVLSTSNPVKIKFRETSLSIIDADMRTSDKIRIQYSSKQSRISNSYKKWIGESRGLNKLDALNVKTEQEKAFQKLAVQRNMEEYTGLLTEFDQVYKELKPLELARDLWIEVWYYGPEIIRYSSGFSKVMKNYESMKADGTLQAELDRLKAGSKGYFKNYNLPTDKKLFSALIDLYHQNISLVLAPPMLGKMNTKYKGDWDAYRDMVYEKSVFTSEADVVAMLESFSAKTVKKLMKDPAIILMKSIDDTYRSRVAPLRGQHNARIDNMMRVYVKGQMEMQPDKTFSADANSTIRLTYGKVEGSSPRDGMEYKPVSYLDGVIEKYIPGDRDYDAPAKLLDLYAKKDYGRYGEDGKMPVCFTGSNHTTGGNSGSPVLNGEGFLIGLNFDRSWESTMSDIMYDPERCRNIAVDIRYVLFIVDKLAGATHLVDEMTVVDADWREKKRMDGLTEEIRNITSTVKSNPMSAEMFFKRGEAYEKMGNTQDAVNDFTVALKWDAKYADAYVARGRVYAATGKPKEALKDLDMAVKYAAESYDAFFARGLVYAEMGDNKKAVVDFSKCTTIDRQNYKAWYNKGLCRIKLGKMNEGCSDLKFAEQLGGKKESYVVRALCGEK
jgi:tetratricopeptide (TPR) repeat protein